MTQETQGIIEEFARDQSIRIQELEAVNAELLAALEACVDAIGDWGDEDDPYYITMANAAIERAKELNK